MTPQKKVTLIEIKYAGKPIQAAFIRHCQEVSCMLGRFDIVNNYSITPSSYKRLHEVNAKYGVGQAIVSVVSVSFKERKE